MLQTANELDERAETIQGNAQAEWPQTPGGLIGVAGSLGVLAVSVGSADSAPTVTSQTAFDEATKQMNDMLAQWEPLQRDFTALQKKLAD